MNKGKFLIFMSMILAVAVVAWSSGDALAQEKGGTAIVKGKVTRDDVAKYLGKVTPSEQKAAAMRARQLGLKPGVAGRAAQVPVTAPASQPPAPGAPR